MVSLENNMTTATKKNSFEDTFARLVANDSPKHKTILTASWFETPLGPMITISDAKSLYLLQFEACKHLEKEIAKIKAQATIAPGTTKPIKMIKAELDLYFRGKLQEFKTPIHLLGSEFQKNAWRALIKIPYGETRSYLTQAKNIGNDKAFRAVANANGANQLSIIIPCHRIINHNGNLGGYAGGIERKKWLLQHEKNHA